jgi:hypothetical protein
MVRGCLQWNTCWSEMNPANLKTYFYRLVATTSRQLLVMSMRTRVQGSALICVDIWETIYKNKTSEPSRAQTAQTAHLLGGCGVSTHHQNLYAEQVDPHYQYRISPRNHRLIVVVIIIYDVKLSIEFACL